MGRKPIKFPKRPRLALISKGINNREVARDLGVSEYAVRSIRKGKVVAMTKLGDTIRRELAKLSGKTVADIWPGMEP